MVSHQIVDAESSPEYGTVAVDDVSFDIVEDDHAPVFGDGESTAREVPENSGPGVNVGAAVEATDRDSDTLTYTLTGTDSVFFGIHEGTGQITTQETSYDFETKPQYAITVTASDTHRNTDSIAVTINLTDVNDAPVFSDGESAIREVPENSGANVEVGAPLSATDQDRTVNTLVYSLTGTDAESFEIVETSGQLQTKSGVSYDRETKPSYSVTVGVSDGTASDSIVVTINLTDANDAPVFTEGDSATRTLPENSGANVNVGAAVTATDQDGNTLTYTLGGTDAGSFEIAASSGQLQTKSGVSYDLETKASYTVTVTATDPDNAADTIAVTVNLTDVNDAPTFSDGENATRSLPENSGADVNVGNPLAATDQDGNTLTYTLGGTDAGSFEIVETSGQLQTKSGVNYDREAKASYSVTVTATDPDNAADTIAVTINLTDANDAPTFSEGDTTTRSLPENSGANVNVGNPVTATDQDGGDTLTYTLSGTDAASFEIDGGTGQLQTKSGVSYDLETKASYTVTVTATDPDNAADTIAVTVNLTDVNDAPTFSDGENATRSLPENSGADVHVGNPLAATDQDGNTLTYTLGGTDAGSFEIVETSGQLQTKSGVSYDLETKASYTVTVGVSDGTAADTIAVTVNLTDSNDAPVFTDGDSTTRSVPENSGANVNVGLPLAATDQDGNTLTYTLGGTDAGSFEIVASSGQLTTKSGVSYDLETKASYTVTVTATDPDNAADSIKVSITIRSSSFGIAEPVGRIPPVLLQAWSGRSFNAANAAPYFGPTPDVFSYEVVSMSPPEVASVRMRGPDAIKGLAASDVIVEALIDGEAVVTLRASTEYPHHAAATQTFWVIVGEKAAIWVTYTRKTGGAEPAVFLNDLLPGGVLDYTYHEWSHGKYRPSGWSWEQLSGPTMELYPDTGANGSFFSLPNLPHGTKLLFRVTAAQSPITLARTGQSATSPATKIFDLLLRVDNPGNGRTVVRPVADAGLDRMARTGESITLDGMSSISPTGGWHDLTYDWQITQAPWRVLQNYAPWTEGVELVQFADSYRASFTMPELYAGESLGFKLSVSIWGQTHSDIVFITSSTPLLPIADAGPDQEQAPGGKVVLQGVNGVNLYGEGVQMEYGWAQLPETTVTLSGETTANPWFILPENAPVGAALEFELTVTDLEGQSNSDTVSVTVRATNPRPTANAGPDLTGAPGASVTLQGTGSTNPYGEWRQLEHAWTQLSGPSVTLDEPTYSAPTFTVPADAANGTTLEFQLTVTDQEGQSDSDTMTVLVVVPEPVLPTACAGPDMTGAPGDEVTLQGKCSVNPYGRWHQMTYQWTQLSGPAVTLTHPRTTQPASKFGDPRFIVPADAADGATLEFELTVTDQEGESDSDTMIVTVMVPEPIRPTATAGPDLTGAPGESATLQGKGSTNSYGRWYQMAHQWTQTSGPTVALTHPKTSQPASNFGDPSFTIPADAAGGTTLEFQLTVTDKEGQSDSDTVTVTVTGAEPEPEPENTPPTASIDAAQVTAAVAGETVALQGVGNDAETAAESLTFAWSQVGGTPQASIVSATTATAAFTAPDVTGETQLTFRLTVTDEGGLSASAETTIAVSPPPEPENTPPTASIDAAQVTTAEAGEMVALQGVGNDAETAAESLTFAWSQVGETPSVSIASASTATAAFTAPDVTEETELTFRLTVTDEGGLSASAETTVTISPPPEPEPNRAPTFDANIDTVLTVAENSAAGTNVGAPITATDPDGNTLTYSLSGADAGSFEIDAATGQVQTKSGVVYDYEARPAYSLAVIADDGKGLSASILVTVNLTDVNEAPAFDEGASATRQVAENSPAGTSIGLPLTATDQDSDTLTYSLSGSDAGSFEIDAATGQLTTIDGVTYDYETKASYAVTVTVEDADHAVATISVTVSLTDVEEAVPNQAPIFDEGDGATRTLAENTAAGENVGLPLTATDPDEDTLTYTLSGADDGSFDLNAATGQLTTVAGVTYDYETKASYAVTVTAEDPEGASASISVTVSLTDVDETLPVTSCFTNLDELTTAAEFSGAWDDPDCRAHHQDSSARYIHFTLSEETEVSITLTPESGGALFVSQGTPQNGWGTPPKGTYEDRRSIRRGNGKLVHDGAHTGLNSVALTLAPGDYTAEAAGTGGTFTLSIKP